MMLNVVCNRKGQWRWLSTKVNSLHPLSKLQYHVVLQIHDSIHAVQKLTLLNVCIAQGKGILCAKATLNGCTGYKRSCHHKSILELTKLIGSQRSTPNGRCGRDPLSERCCVALAHHAQKLLLLVIGVVFMKLRFAFRRERIQGAGASLLLQKPLQIRLLGWTIQNT